MSRMRVFKQQLAQKGLNIQMLLLERFWNLLFLIRDQLRRVFRGHETHSGHRGCQKAYFQSHAAAVGDDEWVSLQMQASVHS